MMYNFLPIEWQEVRMNDPKKFEEILVKYLKSYGCGITNYKSIGEVSVFHQQAVVAAGVYKFFQGTPTNTSSNMTGNGFQRSQSEHMVIMAIEILTGNNATIAATDWTHGAGLAAVKNGYFDLTVNGNVYSKAMPASRANEDLTSAEQGMIGLTMPIVWPAQTDARLDLTTLTAGAANDNVRVMFHGYGLLS